MTGGPNQGRRVQRQMNNANDGIKAAALLARAAVEGTGGEIRGSEVRDSTRREILAQNFGSTGPDGAESSFSVQVSGPNGVRTLVVTRVDERTARLNVLDITQMPVEFSFQGKSGRMVEVQLTKSTPEALKDLLKTFARGYERNGTSVVAISAAPAKDVTTRAEIRVMSELAAAPKTSSILAGLKNIGRWIDARMVPIGGSVVGGLVGIIGAVQAGFQAGSLAIGLGAAAATALAYKFRASLSSSARAMLGLVTAKRALITTAVAGVGAIAGFVVTKFSALTAGAKGALAGVSSSASQVLSNTSSLPLGKYALIAAAAVSGLALLRKAIKSDKPIESVAQLALTAGSVLGMAVGVTGYFPVAILGVCGMVGAVMWAMPKIDKWYEGTWMSRAQTRFENVLAGSKFNKAIEKALSTSEARPKLGKFEEQTEDGLVREVKLKDGQEFRGILKNDRTLEIRMKYLDSVTGDMQTSFFMLPSAQVWAADIDQNKLRFYSRLFADQSKNTSRNSIVRLIRDMNPIEIQTEETAGIKNVRIADHTKGGKLHEISFVKGTSDENAEVVVDKILSAVESGSQLAAAVEAVASSEFIERITTGTNRYREDSASLEDSLRRIGVSKIKS